MRIHDLYKPIFKIWRQRRFEQFRKLIQPGPNDIVLDLGGYPHTWTGQAQDVQRIDCLNLRVYAWPEADFPEHRIRMLAGDACNLAYADKSYPIVFSNSVIEHVGKFTDQQAFAKEARRVGQRLWIQTPAYACPLEPHYLTPFIHWFPPNIRRKLARNFTVWGWLERPDKAAIDEMVDYTRLMTKREMKELFPDCTILTERLLLIFPKSYVAYRN